MYKVGKVIRLADVKFDEESLIRWLKRIEWDAMDIEEEIDISIAVKLLIGGEIFFCEVCDLIDNKKCSGVLLGIKKNRGSSDQGTDYFLVMIDAWGPDEEIYDSLICMGYKYLCNDSQI